MRIPKSEKVATCQRILRKSKKLFETQGFHRTTTRDIATAANIGNGTLFNYFPSKEAIALRLIGQAAKQANQAFQPAPVGTSLEEQLFSFVLSELKQLRPYRHLFPVAVELAFQSSLAESLSWQKSHLSAVQEKVFGPSIGTELTVETIPLYWAQYVGILAFWSRDDSNQQEATLAMLDRSARMFVSFIKHNAPVPVQVDLSRRSYAK